MGAFEMHANFGRLTFPVKYKFIKEIAIRSEWRICNFRNSVFVGTGLPVLLVILLINSWPGYPRASSIRAISMYDDVQNGNHGSRLVPDET
jgi:hypothetical protein